MHRIDSATAQKDKFGPGKNGFTGGNPQTGTPATALNAAFFDSVQEEIASVIESAGIELDAAKNDQLKTAISLIVTGAIPEAPVISVNTKTGAVVLNATDVGAVAKVNNVSPDSNGNVNIDIPGAPVTSVNNKTGAVVLNATDVGAVAKVNNVSPDASGNVNIPIPQPGITAVRLGAQYTHPSTNDSGGAVQLTNGEVFCGTAGIGGSDFNKAIWYVRPIQYLINGQWLQASSI